MHLFFVLYRVSRQHRIPAAIQIRFIRMGKRLVKIMKKHLLFWTFRHCFISAANTLRHFSLAHIRSEHLCSRIDLFCDTRYNLCKIVFRSAESGCTEQKDLLCCNLLQKSGGILVACSFVCPESHINILRIQCVLAGFAKVNHILPCKQCMNLICQLTCISRAAAVYKVVSRNFRKKVCRLWHE